MRWKPRLSSAQLDRTDPPRPTGGEGAAVVGGRVPVHVRLLLAATTRRWRNDGSLDPRIAHRLEWLAAAGWMVRVASPRNFVLWRQGSVQTGSRLPVLVLPDATFRLGEDERNLLALFETMKAACRVEGRPVPLDDATLADLRWQAGRFLLGDGLDVIRPRADPFDEIERRIMHTLSRI